MAFKGLTIMDSNFEHFYIGLDIGGTKCAVVIGNEHFTILRKIFFETVANQPMDK